MNLKKPQSRAYQPHTTRPQSDVLLCAAAHCLREVPAHMVCPEDSHRTPPCRPRPSMLKLCWIHKIAFCFVYLRFSFGTFAQNPSLILLDFTVAPLAGSVDRNIPSTSRAAAMMQSLPLRGAWIEISSKNVLPHAFSGRSPCGERG